MAQHGVLETLQRGVKVRRIPGPIFAATMQCTRRAQRGGPAFSPILAFSSSLSTWMHMILLCPSSLMYFGYFNMSWKKVLSFSLNALARLLVISPLGTWTSYSSFGLLDGPPSRGILTQEPSNVHSHQIEQHLLLPSLDVSAGELFRLLSFNRGCWYRLK